MSRDFTLSKYEELLDSIAEAKYPTTNVRDYWLKKPSRCIILRHDVDRDVERAMDMAETEKQRGISSTYYFRHVKDVFKPDEMKKIEKMGHEVGYHYEVMDKAKGNPKVAVEIFSNELHDFRKHVDVTTACMHGNPLASWSNRDLWQKYDYRDYDIICEPYLAIDYDKVFYVTDTGRTWADRNIRVKDVVCQSKEGIKCLYLNKIKSTDDVISMIKSNQIGTICTLIHPNRWCNGIYGWTKELLMQNIKNVGKAGIIAYNSSRTTRED